MTAIRISRPCAANCQNGEMRINVNEFWITPNSSAPNITPGTVLNDPGSITVGGVKFDNAGDVAHQPVRTADRGIPRPRHRVRA